jgi:hypothetical protein
MRCLILLLGVLSFAGCDDAPAPGNEDLSVADAAMDLGGPSPDLLGNGDGNMMVDGNPGPPDLNPGPPFDLSGVDLVGGCATISCSPGPIGNAQCKGACLSGTATCGAGGFCML